MSSIIIGESWLQVNSKTDVDKVSNRHSSLENNKSATGASNFVPIRRNDSKYSTGALDWNIKTNVLEPQILGIVRKEYQKGS